MRLTGFGRGAVLVASLALASACDVAFAQKESETVNKTVAFPANGTLRLHNFSGDVRITATSGHDVVIKAVREADRDRLDHIKLDIETSGSTVSIEANKREADWSHFFMNDNVVNTTFDIQVPASAMLDLNAFSSDVSIAGVTGSQKLKTFSGRIAVTGAKSSLTAETFSGGVEIEAKAAGPSPDLSVQTFSGRITARLADNATGAVSFSSFSGHFDSDLSLALHTTKRGASSLRFQTFSGNVKIAK